MVAVLDDYTPIIDTAIATIKELVNSSSSDFVN
jgi:membrane protein required for colicin V production